MKIRCVGDVHQNYQSYFPLLKDCDYSIQLGDMGFDYKPIDHLIGTNHFFFKGNHDNYDINHKQDLGDYGSLFDGKVFFMRGAWSIDGIYRQNMMKDPRCEKIWFEQEELNLDKLYKAKDEYIKTKPEIMLSHDCPFSIYSHLNLSISFAKSFGYNTNEIPSRTSLALESMFQFHKPKMWLHGHMHRDFNKIINGTRFICLTADLNKDHCKQRYWDIHI